MIQLISASPGFSPSLFVAACAYASLEEGIGLQRLCLDLLHFLPVCVWQQQIAPYLKLVICSPHQPRAKSGGTCGLRNSMPVEAPLDITALRVKGVKGRLAVT